MPVSLAEAGHAYLLERHKATQNGETITGILKANVKISLAHGVTVTISSVTISSDEDIKYWMGRSLTIKGNATLMAAGGKYAAKGRDAPYSIEPRTEGSGEGIIPSAGTFFCRHAQLQPSFIHLSGRRCFLSSESYVPALYHKFTSGAITILFGLSFSHAPHHENVLGPIITCLH